jgi:signal transduction histidine kinase
MADWKGPNGQIRFIRVLAHDLRNPISGILAASQCLIEDASPVLDDQQITLLRSIESSSELMLRLIEDMLEVTQAASGPSRLRLRPTDVSRLVARTAAMQRPLAETRNIRLNMQLDGAIPPLDLDPSKIAQALNVLLMNVVRCSPAGGQIDVGVAAGPKKVVISARHSSVDARNSPRLGDFSRRKIKLGSDITLAALRLIVERHGGAIRLESRSFHPAFTLTLPRSRVIARQAAAPPRQIKKGRRSTAAG